MLVIPKVGHGQEKSHDDFAKAAQNPLASMISLPFQNNTNFGSAPNLAKNLGVLAGRYWPKPAAHLIRC